MPDRQGITYLFHIWHSFIVIYYFYGSTKKVEDFRKTYFLFAFEIASINVSLSNALSTFAILSSVLHANFLRNDLILKLPIIGCASFIRDNTILFIILKLLNAVLFIVEFSSSLKLASRCQCKRFS